MKAVSISGSSRANVGKKDAQELRRSGSVPCVIYGGKEQIHFSVPEGQFKQLIYTHHAHSVKLDVDGKKFDAILQDVQYHRVHDHILHVDFLEVIPGKPVVMYVPIQETGNSPGVKAGGKLMKKVRKLKVKGLLDQMPDIIEVDINKVELGQSVRVGDLKQDNVELLDSPDLTILSVKMTRAGIAEESTAEAPEAEATAEGEGGEAAPEAAAEEAKS